MGEQGAAQRASPEPDDAVGTSTVLVVDDDDATRRLFVRALTRAGFDTRDAADGPTALELVEAEPISVVLLDGRMPGMSGLDVLEALRLLPGGATLPVVFVTGQHELDDRIRGLEAGANDYLTKPVELDELVARVRSQLRASDAWTHAVDDIERRLDAVMLLRRIRRSEVAEHTASEVCAEVSELEGIAGAAVVVVRGARSVVPLAVHGVLGEQLVAGEPLDERLSPRIASRLRRGPWVDTVAPTSVAPGLLAAVVGHDVAFAPLAGGDGPIGALLLAGTRSEIGTPPMLSAAIDFAAVVGALIAPELERDEAITDARMRLRSIVTDGAFEPYFQPVLDLETGSTVGYEALTRWKDGTRPDLRFAEASSLGIDIEIERATLGAQLDAAHALDPTTWLSVNVSSSLVTSGVLGEVLAAADRPIILELTEHEPIDDYAALSAAVRALPDVRLAVDDAGAGYSSMRHVLDLRPELVKLDITWVRGLDVDPARQALVSGMTGFAGELGCALVAEGIETEGELAALRRLGIGLGQGYLLGRPAPADAW